ncbi:MAG TPA: hypothetical protein VFR55_14165 [Dehalococcoidia bacterium]|nr:hypothetical protein [Dehalococcoidia bacterium]
MYSYWLQEVSLLQHLASTSFGNSNVDAPAGPAVSIATVPW